MADEKICIRTAQGLVCYENSTPRYYKTRGSGGAEIPISPPHDTPVVNEHSAWWEKLHALIHVAQHQSDMDLDGWTIITHGRPGPGGRIPTIDVRDTTSTADRVTWPIALVATAAIVSAAWIVVSGPVENITRVTDYLLSSLFPVVIGAVFGGAAGAIGGKTAAERAVRRARELRSLSDL